MCRCLPAALLALLAVAALVTASPDTTVLSVDVEARNGTAATVVVRKVPVVTQPRLLSPLGGTPCPRVPLNPQGDELKDVADMFCAREAPELPGCAEIREQELWRKLWYLYRAQDTYVAPRACNP